MMVGAGEGTGMGGVVGMFTRLGDEAVLSVEGVKTVLSEDTIPTYTARIVPSAAVAEPMATRILESVSKKVPCRTPSLIKFQRIRQAKARRNATIMMTIAMRLQGVCLFV